MRAVLVLTAAGLASCATGPAQAPAAEAAPAVAAATTGMTPAQIVAARQSAFHLSAAAFGGMKTAVDGGAEPGSQAFAARGLARWAQTLPTMFPEGTQLPTSRAKPEAWSARADFEAKAAAYQAAATRLAEVAEGGDKAAFTAQWTALRGTCSACHDVYRAPARRPAG